MFLPGWSQSNKPMAKIKLVLDQRRPSASGLYTLKFRVTHQTKSAEISTAIKASPLEFDDKRECLIKKTKQNDLLFSQRKLFECRYAAKETNEKTPDF
jgi:hypothetical protein